MSGIYLHIPFCKQACHYCDFHFSTSLNFKNDFVDSLIHEIELRKSYLSSNKISTIYFGGGTPSLLSVDELNRVFEKIFSVFTVGKDAEITLEANPDDLTNEKLTEFKQTPINRLSIGIQSFSDEDLKFMNRAHNAQEAKSSVMLAQNHGFKNISVDLIYGTPTLSDEQWKKNMEQVAELNVQHLSCYSLTIEPNTPLASFIKKGKSKNVSDEDSARHLEMLMDWASQEGFIHYEISNFGKENYFSKHNSSYWKGEHFIGLGPSAHSFDGKTRQWNISNNPRYIQAISKGELLFENEELTLAQRYNEYIMTSLRTHWGCRIDFVKKEFGNQYADSLEKNSRQFINEGFVSEQNGFLILTKTGKLFADKIASELFAE